MKRLFAVVPAAFIFGFAGAAAAESDLEEAIEAAIACRDIAADGDRLACLDAAAGALSSARERLVQEKADRKRGLLADFGLRGDDDEDDEEDKPRVKETEADFGAEDVPELRAEREEEQLDEVVATATSITVNSLNEATIHLANGQVWRQLESDSTVIPRPKKGQSYAVVIRRAAMGSYLATIEGMRRPLRVRRLK
jgi:hypothetical protein